MLRSIRSNDNFSYGNFVRSKVRSQYSEITERFRFGKTATSSTYSAAYVCMCQCMRANPTEKEVFFITEFNNGRRESKIMNSSTHRILTRCAFSYQMSMIDPLKTEFELSKGI